MTIGQKESGWNEKDSEEDRERKTTDDGLRQGSITAVRFSSICQLSTGLNAVLIFRCSEERAL
jgi:hypothetical protein